MTYSLSHRQLGMYTFFLISILLLCKYVRALLIKASQRSWMVLLPYWVEIILEEAILFSCIFTRHLLNIHSPNGWMNLDTILHVALLDDMQRVFLPPTFLKPCPFSRKILEYFRTITVVLRYESYFRKDFTPLWAYYTKQMPRKH